VAKWLLVGDPHAVVDELEDCQNLVKGILEVVRSERPDCVVFLGDQHHNHAIVHVDVMGFWRESFHLLTEVGQVKVYALVGNHDMPGDGVSRNHAMMAYADMPSVTVVDYPTPVGDVLLCPYFPRGDDLRAAVIGNPRQRVIICHQTIVGSRYENGFIAQDGVSLERLEDKFFISGHIHTPQKYDNVVYVGAPRWRSFFDADVDRALTLWNIQDGKAELVKLFDTSRWCKKLVHVLDSQEAPFQGEINPAWRYIVDLHGDDQYIASRRSAWNGHRVRATRKQEQVSPMVRESMGIGTAITAFIDTYQPKYGTSLGTLREMVAVRLQ
jgi:DNA repair exonuclease SbcCD nuclease subunit